MNVLEATATCVIDEVITVTPSINKGLLRSQSVPCSHCNNKMKLENRRRVKSQHDCQSYNSGLDLGLLYNKSNPIENNDNVSLSIKATSKPFLEFASLTSQVAQAKNVIRFQKDISTVVLQTAAIEARVQHNRFLKSERDIECIKLRSLYNEAMSQQNSFIIGQRVNDIKTIDNSFKSNLSTADLEFLNSINDNLSLKTHYIMSSWFDVLPLTVEERTWALRT